MPHITVCNPMKLTKEEEQKLVSKLGELITIIPNKDEKGLMVSVNSENHLYHGGEVQKKAFYLEVKIFKDCPRESKKKFAYETIKMLEEEFLVPKAHIYVNFFEVFDWAAGGRLMDI